MSERKVSRQIDTSGKCCPMPIVETNMAIKKVNSGEILEIIATDPGTQTDIPAWCERTGNTLVESSEADGSIHFYVQKS
jgi:tRNA 2-thiouridine synthesizing protein A